MNAPKLSTVYRNIKTGKFVRTYHNTDGKLPGFIGYYCVTKPDGTWYDKKGAMLATSNEKFMARHVEV